jgi:RNA-directed DNA polymerase
VALSPEKTRITHINQGFDFLGQTLRKHGNGKLRITPSKDSLKKIKAKVSDICKDAKGLSQAQLIGRLNPVLRGWANYHRHSICAASFAQLDSHVWTRVFRWARRRHSNKTGRWIADRYFIHTDKQRWLFQDKQTGKRLIRVASSIKHPRHVKVKAQANPFDEAWEGYFKQRSQRQAEQSTKGLRAKVLKRVNGICIVCRQTIQQEDGVDLHHLNGNHDDNRLGNRVLLHPNCHRQVHHNGSHPAQPHLPYPEGVCHA